MINDVIKPVIILRRLFNKFFVSLLFVPLIANSQTRQSYNPPILTDQDRLAKLQAAFPEVDKIYREYAEKNHFPGYTFGVVVDGRLIHSGSGGYADLEQKIPATTHSLFRIASMTKSFTAMAILKLRDEGRLNLDAPVALYLPEIKNQGLTRDAPEITIRHLLTHSAGFPEDDPWGDRKLAETSSDLVALYKKGISFSTATGTAYEYSNLGFATLGYVIGKASGQPYQEFIRKQIWQPLGMHQASWEFSSIPKSERVQGYHWADGVWKKEKMLHDGSFGAMGGMLTSVEAFSRYIALHEAAWPPRDEMDKGPLKRSSLREMHHPWNFHELISDYKFIDGEAGALSRAYGYGLTWTQDSRGRVYVGHTGGLPGFGSNWAFLPEYGVGVVFLANLTYAPAREANQRVLETLIQQAQLKPRELPTSQILKEKQAALLKYLPHWEDAESSSIFARNFFLDHSIAVLKKETREAFAKAGKIKHVGELHPENQLRGSFILEGEKTKLEVHFTLSPDKPALIQAYQIKEVI